MNYTQQLLDIRNQLSAQLAEHFRQLQGAPPGKLAFQKNGGYLKWLRSEENPGGVCRQAILRKDVNQAQLLAVKSYHMEMAAALEKQIALLDGFLKEAASVNVPAQAGLLAQLTEIGVNASFRRERTDIAKTPLQGLLTPGGRGQSQLDPSAELVRLIGPAAAEAYEWFFSWCFDRYEYCQDHPEHLTYPAECGLKMRSKSEVFICDTLLHSSLAFRYEQPLRLGQQIVYPDFTILLGPGRVIYWEHLGKLLDQRYNSNNRLKISDYIENGYYPGRDLIITCEDERSPLDHDLVTAIVGSLCKRFYSCAPFSPTKDRILIMPSFH